MQIRELYLKNFGKFSEHTVLLKEGMNVLYGENEFGKTTLHAFIKGMLFGMEKGRGRAAKNGTFSIYEPWDNPNYYAGVLKFACAGKHFCLERNFDKYTKKASLICEDDGEILSIEHGDLEMLLGGLTASNYENTVAVGQLCIETNRDLASELKNYATNYYGTGNSEIQLWQAMDVLKVKKKNIESAMKELVLKRQSKKEKVEQESNYVWRDIQKNTEEISNLNKEMERLKAVKPTIPLTAPLSKRWRIHPLTCVLMPILVVAPFAIVERPWNYLWALVIILAEGLFVWNRLKDGKSNLSEKAPEHYGELKEIKAQNLDKLKWKKELLQEELKEKQIMYSNLKEYLQELDEVSDEYLELDKHKRAILLATEKIVEISTGINKEFGIVLEEKASEILEVITNGKYAHLLIDDELNMSLHQETKRIAIEQVSRGTVEQIYFALRMAAAEMLYQEELPVILDEAFVHYDDKRLENILQWLYENKRQVIIFTCQKREMKLLNHSGIPY